MTMDQDQDLSLTIVNKPKGLKVAKEDQMAKWSMIAVRYNG